VIRVVTIASLLTLLSLVLYLPVARPASAFIAIVRSEHATLSECWGRQHALEMLERMLQWQPETLPSPPLAPVAQTAATGNGNVNKEVAAVGTRLLNNEYFRSLNALFVLSTYRMAVVSGLLPGILPFMFGALVDGFVRRTVKGKVFAGHSPEAFSACACGVIVAACLLVLVSTVPMQLPPILLPFMLVAIACFANVGIANYRKRVDT
jgi:hypothetical protein